MLYHVGLCLAGFDVNEPLVVEVVVGTSTFRTPVEFDDQAVDYPDPDGELPRTTLFDGDEVTMIRLTDSDYFQSDAWRFVPSSRARDLIVAAGRITIRARQEGGSRSDFVQDVKLLEGPGQTWISTKELTLYGFEPDARVPVGLYRVTDDTTGMATLVRKLTVLTVPRSGIVVYQVPEWVLSNYGGNESHCLAGPANEYAGRDMDPDDAPTVYNCSVRS